MGPSQFFFCFKLRFSKLRTAHVAFGGRLLWGVPLLFLPPRFDYVPRRLFGIACRFRSHRKYRGGRRSPPCTECGGVQRRPLVFTVHTVALVVVVVAGFGASFVVQIHHDAHDHHQKHGDGGAAGYTRRLQHEPTLWRCNITMIWWKSYLKGESSRTAPINPSWLSLRISTWPGITYIFWGDECGKIKLVLTQIRAVQIFVFTSRTHVTFCTPETEKNGSIFGPFLIFLFVLCCI